MFTDAQLIAYLDEAAPVDQIAAIEAALRDDDELRERLSAITSGRDAGLHSLGEVWRRRRMTCPTREQLGSHLLGVLDETHAEYVTFHLEVVCCRQCEANVADLREKHAASADDDSGRRRERYFQSSVGRLKDSDA